MMKWNLISHGWINAAHKTLSCHASSVLPLKDGRVLAAWFGGSCESADDVDIWMAEGKDGVFGEPRRVVTDALPCWNPVLFERTDGSIVLFYKVGKTIPDWKTMVCESSDGGKNWSAPRELVPGDESGGRGPVRNHPLRLDNGRILAPASVERGIWRCFADISDDDGCSWRRSPLIEIPALNEIEEKLLSWKKKLAAGECRPEDVPDECRHGRGIIQPALWQDADGVVHALMRSGEGFLYRSDSSDRGETWSEPVPTSMPNNNGGVDLVRLPDGTLILCCNPVTESWGARTPVSLFASRDNGAAWEKMCDLETGPGEYSYPSLAVRGRRVFLTYTWRRENIAYWEFEY